MIKFFAAIVIALIIFPASASASASAAPTPTPAITASIRPIAMLIKAVVGSDIPVRVMLSSNVSPHDYELKFSDIRSIKNSDLFVWVGPELESGLHKAIKNHPSDSIIQLTKMNNINWPELHPEHSHSHKEHGDAMDGELRGEYNRDPHIWLDPENILAVVKELSSILGNRYPEYKNSFDKNVEKFSLMIIDIDREMKKKFEQVKDKGFIVVHDGYGHFVEHYGLHQIGIISVIEGMSPTAKHRAKLAELSVDAACIFTDPQHNNKIARQLASNYKLKSKELDPMGQSIDLKHNSFIEFYSDFSNTVLACLE